MLIQLQDDALSLIQTDNINTIKQGWYKDGLGADFQRWRELKIYYNGDRANYVLYKYTTGVSDTARDLLVDQDVVAITTAGNMVLI